MRTDRRVPPGVLRRPAARSRPHRTTVSSVKYGVQDDHVHRRPHRASEFGPERGEADGDVLVEGGIEMEDRIAADGAVVAHDHLAVEQPAQHADEVLDLGRGDAGDA